MIQIGQIKPFYDLSEIKELLKKSETRHITRSSYQTAVAVGFASHLEMVDAVLELSLYDFYKTMPGKTMQGTFQDVYKKEINGINLYIKLQKLEGKGVIISFKRDEQE